ncbi:hypothetical protein V5799_005196, partial [Amblyomma americanum]
MKLVHKYIEKDGSGNVTLIPEEAEDMWHAYNLMSQGDSLKASTIRKVTTESATGSTGSNRVRTTLVICIESIDFDTQACMLRVKGRNIAENQYVKDQFYEYMFQAATKLDLKVLLENKGKFVLTHASSGFKHSLK